MKNKQLLFNLIITGGVVFGTLLLFHLQGYTISKMSTMTFLDCMEFIIPSLGFYGLCRWLEYFFLQK
ncbi:hypothetical protein [Bacillus toyonensis]|uniref:hypothetical protein n=1 Tax=Bacillus toyonensis TaxID=155322 RepID=UPI000BFBE2F9|nr:hypothetical protein [Bacillus toyonensis]PHG07235.1 hypothetical protein COI66_18165 [Bacillus toyonensis]